MDQVKSIGFKRITEDFDDTIPRTPIEDFVALIYRFADAAAARELLLLQRQNNIVPTCKRGCYSCCNQYILTNRSEAHALGQFIRREFRPQEIHSLRLRTFQWHVWNEDRHGDHRVAGAMRPGASAGNRPFCPLLVDGSCRAYPVRPIICRTHFVCSPPALCRSSSDHSAATCEPTALTSVVTATNRFANRLKTSINKSGPDFSRETMLLPHWLEIEMGWDFSAAT